MSRETSTRRRFLELGGVALTTGFAGCSTSVSTSDSTATQSPTPSGSRPAEAQASPRNNPYTQVYRDTISSAVNPGNSGGPLMDLDGSMVGVVNSKQGDSIAFGISTALTERVVPELIESGSYEHAYMGASLDVITPSIAEANDLDDPKGLLVVQIVRGGPADGVLQPSSIEYVDGARVPVGGDVIFAIEETQMDTFEDLASHLALETRPGDTIDVTIVRDGTEQTVELTLGARPDRSTSPLG